MDVNIKAPGIIFQDSDILVLDKPSGWITNEADTTKEIPVIQSWLKKEFNYEIAKADEYRSGIVHRLDKDTSGCLIVAKNKDVFYELQRQFKDREVEKTYIALVHGIIKDPVQIEAEVGRLPWNRKRFGILSKGRGSITDCKPLSHHINESGIYTLAQFNPKTGRTHQIRIHSKYIGHPIVSDDFYAGRKTARSDKKWCSRLFLHSNKIVFSHPKNLKRAEFSSPLPNDLKMVLDSLSPTD